MQKRHFKDERQNRKGWLGQKHERIYHQRLGLLPRNGKLFRLNGNDHKNLCNCRKNASGPDIANSEINEILS